ncbi:MAG TPA: sugar ABC transporter permease [Thermoanaerobaculia bacterium]|nr:sugar ABC transporter permease [Thermoanaerobaculia bacterium]
MTNGKIETGEENSLPVVAGTTRPGRWGASVSSLRAYAMLFALMIIWAYFQWMTASELYPYGLFLHPVNLANLLKQMSVTGVLAVGMLFVIVARQIDLSVGSVVGLAGGVAAMTQGWGLLPSFAAAIAIGVATGALHGALVAYANIPAFIVTLGGLLTWRGVILYLTKGETIPVRLPVFRLLGVALMTRWTGLILAGVAVLALVWMTIRRNRARLRHGLPVPGVTATVLRIVMPALLIVLFTVAMNSQGGVPLPVILLLAVATAGAFLTQTTTFGRYLYAIGSNPDAARLSGINSRRHILAAFALLGGLVGIASLLHTGRVGSASPDAGTLMELDAIAACVIGGTSLMGGRGTVAGALLGALVMASLDNGMSLLSVENATQYIIKGAVLVAAVGFDMAGRKRS